MIHFPFGLDTRTFYALLCRIVEQNITPQWGVMKDLIQFQLRAFGGNVRRLRNAKRLSQEKLAELAALNIRTVQKIEAGQTNILITTASRIQRALAADWAKLMEM